MHIERYTAHGILNVHLMWAVAWRAVWDRHSGIGSFTSTRRLGKEIGLRALTVEGSI